MEVLKTMKDLKPFQRMQNVYINHFDTKMINFSLKGFKIILKAHGDVARAIYTQFKRNKYIYTYIYIYIYISKSQYSSFPHGSDLFKFLVDLLINSKTLENNTKIICRSMTKKICYQFLYCIEFHFWDWKVMFIYNQLLGV